jgi:hypothetical protein
VNKEGENCSSGEEIEEILWWEAVMGIATLK